MALIGRLLPHLNRLLFLVLTIALVYAVKTYLPKNIDIIFYKVTLVTIGAVLGYWIDVLLFPHFKPKVFKGAILDHMKAHHTTDGVSGLCTISAGIQVRRAIVIFATILTMGIGL
jgi:hypothetical protein